MCCSYKLTSCSAPDLIARLGRWLPWKHKDKNGQTPLFALCRSYDHARYREMVHIAIKHAQYTQRDGARLHLDEHVDGKGNTLLHIAGDPTVLRTLLKCDSEVNATNNRGFTALMVASKYGRVEMVRTLFGDARVDILAKELRGLTAVELAKDDDVRNRIDGRSPFLSLLHKLPILSVGPGFDSVPRFGIVPEPPLGRWKSDCSCAILLCRGCHNPSRSQKWHTLWGINLYDYYLQTISRGLPISSRMASIRKSRIVATGNSGIKKPLPNPIKTLKIGSPRYSVKTRLLPQDTSRTLDVINARASMGVLFGVGDPTGSGGGTKQEQGRVEDGASPRGIPTYRGYEGCGGIRYTR